VAEEIPLNVDRKSYFLRPDQPPEGAPRRMFDGETETDLAPAMQERARGVGLTMRRPPVAPNTSLAFQATLYAKEKGLDGEFHHAAAKAYWETGVNLGEMAVLQKVAQEVGLDWAELEGRLQSGHYQQQVMDEHADAKARDVGVVPTYVVDGEYLKGDVSLEDLQAAIRKASA
jgi:predicted DsbA family dithiol-disulfide isomerase